MYCLPLIRFDGPTHGGLDSIHFDVDRFVPVEAAVVGGHGHIGLRIEREAVGRDSFAEDTSRRTH